MTLKEIGERFGLTRERVRQIKEKAIRRLRHTSRSKLLKTYFVSTWVMRFPNRISLMGGADSDLRFFG